MSNQLQMVEGQVEAVNSTGPFNGRNGQYFKHTFTVNGMTCSKLANSNEFFEANPGDTVKLLVETVTTDSGSFNNIKKLDIKEKKSSFSNTGGKTTSSPEQITFTVKPTEAPFKSFKPKSPEEESAKNLSIARMNAVTSAVNFLTSSDTPTSMDKVFKLADEIVQYTMEPYHTK